MSRLNNWMTELRSISIRPTVLVFGDICVCVFVYRYIFGFGEEDVSSFAFILKDLSRFLWNGIHWNIDRNSILCYGRVQQNLGPNSMICSYDEGCSSWIFWTVRLYRRKWNYLVTIITFLEMKFAACTFDTSHPSSTPCLYGAFSVCNNIWIGPKLVQLISSMSQGTKSSINSILVEA